MLLFVVLRSAPAIRATLAKAIRAALGDRIVDMIRNRDRLSGPRSLSRENCCGTYLLVERSWCYRAAASTEYWIG